MPSARRLLKTIGFKRICALSGSRFLAGYIDSSNKWGFFFIVMSKGEYSEGRYNSLPPV